jgi:hypothetical protein
MSADTQPRGKKPTLADRAIDDPDVVTRLMFGRLLSYVQTYARVEVHGWDVESGTFECTLAGVRFSVSVERVQA